MEVRGGLEIAAPLELLEPRPEARDHLPLEVVRGREQPVDALLPFEDRAEPPLHQADDHAPAERDERADDRLAAPRVVLDLLIERLRERGEWILQVVGEDAPPARERDAQERFDVRAVDALLAFLADPLAHLGHEGVEVDRLDASGQGADSFTTRARG